MRKIVSVTRIDRLQNNDIWNRIGITSYIEYSKTSKYKGLDTVWEWSTAHLLQAHTINRSGYRARGRPGKRWMITSKLYWTNTDIAQPRPHRWFWNKGQSFHSYAYGKCRPTEPSSTCGKTVEYSCSYCSVLVVCNKSYQVDEPSNDFEACMQLKLSLSWSTS